ncbi:MAG: hypothetical protein IKQ91_07520 [Oscillospiraceae bacterium]|nr:hypothetical protein [Oscillospiraceae bacterium]
MPIKLYDINPLCYAAGAILSTVLFAVIWFLLLRGTWTLGRHWHPVWILEAIQPLLLIFGLYFTAMVVMSGDLFTSVRPEWVQGFIFLYLAAAVILIAADCIMMTLRAKERQQWKRWCLNVCKGQQSRTVRTECISC